MSPNEEQQVQSEINDADGLQTLSQDEIQIISEGVDALRSILGENAAVGSEIEEVIREHLGTVVTSDSLRKIFSGLTLYLGSDTAVFLLESLRRGDESSYIEQVKTQCTEQVWVWLRRLIALYAFELRKTFTAANENPNAWDVLNRHTYYDSLTDSWSIFLEIVKYSGESFTIEETPRGALTLAQGIIEMLMSIPAKEAPYLIESEYLAEIHKQFLQLRTLYAPEQLTESAEKVDA